MLARIRCDRAIAETIGTIVMEAIGFGRVAAIGRSYLAIGRSFLAIVPIVAKEPQALKLMFFVVLFVFIGFGTPYTNRNRT